MHIHPVFLSGRDHGAFDDEAPLDLWTPPIELSEGLPELVLPSANTTHPRYNTYDSAEQTSATDSTDELIAAGAVPWLLSQPTETANDMLRVAHQQQTSDSANPPRRIPNGPLERPEEWLCHWTRPCFGPWLDQTNEDYWDELILGCVTADRSAFGTLMRIVHQQKLFASQSVRGAAATVSFTDVPLSEFRSRRVYRRHKHRYDFEPYGIAIRRKPLQQTGVRKVEYVAPEEYKVIESRDEFVQPKSNVDSSIDWSEEGEWRHIGDLDLARVDPNDVVFFAKSENECDVLRGVSPWPIVRVPHRRDRHPPTEITD